MAAARPVQRQILLQGSPWPRTPATDRKTHPLSHQGATRKPAARWRFPLLLFSYWLLHHREMCHLCLFQPGHAAGAFL